MDTREEHLSYTTLHHGSHIVCNDPAKLMTSQLTFPSIHSGQPSMSAVTHIVNVSDLTYSDSSLTGDGPLSGKMILTDQVDYATLEAADEVHREGSHQQHMQVEEEHIEGLLKLCSSMGPKGRGSNGDANRISSPGGVKTSDNISNAHIISETTDVIPGIDLQQENEILKDQIQQLHEQIQKLSGGKPKEVPNFIGHEEAQQNRDNGMSHGHDTLPVSDSASEPSFGKNSLRSRQRRANGKESDPTAMLQPAAETDLAQVMADMEQLKKSLKEKNQTIIQMKKDSLRKSEAILKKQKELKTVREKLKTVVDPQVNAEVKQIDPADNDVNSLDPVTAAALAELGGLICKQCGKVCLSSEDLDQHIVSHTQGKRKGRSKPKKGDKDFFYCDVCDKVFSSSKYLCDHKKRAHGAKDDDVARDSTTIKDDTLTAVSYGRIEDKNIEYIPENTITIDPTVDTSEDNTISNWGCDVCKKCFSTSSNLHKHKRNVHKIERTKQGAPVQIKPKCEKCGKAFDRLSAMYRHMKKAHDKESEDEASSLEEKEGMDESSTGDIMEDGKRFQCPKCRDVFSTLSNLYRHKRNVHGIESPGLARQYGSEEDCVEASKYAIFDDSGKKRYKCDLCNLVLNGASNLFRHLRRHGGEKKFDCEQCGKKFAQKSSLSAHEKIHTGIRPHVCTYCGKSFLERKCLMYHIRNHTGDKPYKCDDCDASFVIKSKLERHKRQHCDDRPYQCDICGKCFTQIFYLKQHKRTHNGLRPFHCDVCERRFTQRTNLARHMRTHTGEKPYQCENCGKSFATLYSLENHKRTHTGERPFACTECPLSFAERNSLKRHLRIHSGEKPYNCDICGRAFSRKYDVKKHKRIHTGEKAYYCHVCGAGFNHKSDLEKHSKTHLAQQEDATKELYRQAYEFGFETVNSTQTMPVLANPTPNTLNLAPVSLPTHQNVLQTLQPPPATHHYTYTHHPITQQGHQPTPWLMTFHQPIHEGHG